MCLSKAIAPAVFLVTATVVPSLAHAEVTASSDEGFNIKIVAMTTGSPKKVYSAIVSDIGQWWDPAHTYSGQAENLYFETTEKGWFGERLKSGGFVRHLEVVHLAPNETIRLLGGLGPLQEMGVHGALTISLTPSDQGTSILLTYNVSGFSPSGFERIAKAVDGVLAAQIERLQIHLSRE